MNHVLEYTHPLDDLAEFFADDMKAVNGCILSRMGSSVPLIPQLAGYLIAAGGKRVRPLLTLAATSFYGGDMAKAHVLAAAVEFIHTATLLHDDVVDESIARRGRDSANIVFGNQASVLVGDFLFARAFQLMVETGDLRVLEILSGASAIITEGEVLQLSVAGQVDTPMETYLKVIEGKTAALFRAACQVGPVIAGADEGAIAAMANYGLYLGIAFQIADDALDYSADRQALGKTIGDDFREKKMTAPVILAYQKATPEEKDFWRRVMNSGEVQEPDDLKKAQQILHRCAAVEDSLALARDYGDKAIYALNSVPEHTCKKMLVDLVRYSIARQS